MKAQLRSPQPIPGAGPITATQRMIAKTFDYSGRASRSEYWWGGLAVASTSAIPFAYEMFQQKKRVAQAQAVAKELGLEAPQLKDPSLLLTNLSFVPWVPALLSLQTRRYHDVNLSGKWQFADLVAMGAITLVVSVKRSNPKGARFDQS